MNKLLKEIKRCTACAKHLPFDPNPILNFEPAASLLIVGQAPGRRAHDSAIPWNDASGDRLREWMGMGKSDFYNPNIVAIVPMGFCYPGTGKSGDLPPRPECAPLWMRKVLGELKNIKLKLIIGAYAQSYFIKDQSMNLTETVRAWKKFSPDILPLPHPSPRNNIWLKKNPWFEKELLPHARKRIVEIISCYQNYDKSALFRHNSSHITPTKKVRVT